MLSLIERSYEKWFVQARSTFTMGPLFPKDIFPWLFFHKKHTGCIWFKSKVKLSTAVFIILHPGNTSKMLLQVYHDVLRWPASASRRLLTIDEIEGKLLVQIHIRSVVLFIVHTRSILVVLFIRRPSWGFLHGWLLTIKQSNIKDFYFNLFLQLEIVLITARSVSEIP